MLRLAIAVLSKSPTRNSLPENLMPTSQFVRGQVLKCLFPYDNASDRPGPHPHYCLYVQDVEVQDKRFVMVCYGTSRLDPALLRAHSGMILSVRSPMIKGEMPGDVTHIVADHVALLPCNDDWIYGSFDARLDFVKESSRTKTPEHRRLYDAFVAFERVMKRAASDGMSLLIANGTVGLPPHITLR